MGSSVLLPLLLVVLFSAMAFLSDARNFKGQWLKANDLLSDATNLEGQWPKTSMLLKEFHPKGRRDSFSSLPLLSDMRYLEEQQSLPSNSKYMEGPWSKTTMFHKKSHIKGHEDSFSSLPPSLPDARYLNLKGLQDFLTNVPLLSDTRNLEGNRVKTSWFLMESLIKGDKNSSKGSSCTHDPIKKDPSGDKCPIPP